MSALPPLMDLEARATSLHSGVYSFYLEAVIRLDVVDVVAVAGIQALAVLVVAIGVDQDS